MRSMRLQGLSVAPITVRNVAPAFLYNDETVPDFNLEPQIGFASNDYLAGCDAFTD